MKLGFIGTGNIVTDVVTGICKSKISFTKIIISPRNRANAQKLKRKFKNVNINGVRYQVSTLYKAALFPITGSEYDIDPLKSTHSLDEVYSSDFVFVCVPTPDGDNGWSPIVKIFILSDIFVSYRQCSVFSSLQAYGL